MPQAGGPTGLLPTPNPCQGLEGILLWEAPIYPFGLCRGALDTDVPVTCQRRVTMARPQAPGGLAWCLLPEGTATSWEQSCNRAEDRGKGCHLQGRGPSPWRGEKSRSCEPPVGEAPQAGLGSFLPAHSCTLHLRPQGLAVRHSTEPTSMPPTSGATGETTYEAPSGMALRLTWAGGSTRRQGSLAWRASTGFLPFASRQ